MPGIADTRELQQMRRADGTRRQDHSTRCIDTLDPAASRILHTDRAGPSEQQPMRQSIGEDFEIGPLLCRAEIGARRTLPPPSAAGLLNPADVIARAPRQMVDVFVIFEAALDSGLDDLV